MALDSPLLLSPVFKPKIWGRENLSPLFPRPEEYTRRFGPGAGFSSFRKAGDRLMGEVWLTDDSARFMNGALAGMSLGEASRKLGPELHGRRWKDGRFPILAKYIFTSDWLSVQVHPDDDYARVNDPGSLGKCEMWYVVHRDRNAGILLGLKPGTHKDELRAACEKGTSREVLNQFAPKEGEAMFIPPGTVHALGPGLVLFEAEQNSDLTYRLDDFGRLGLDGKPRPLHLDKGMDVARPELPTYRDLPRVEVRESFGSRRYVLASRLFAVEELAIRGPACFESNSDRVEVLSVLGGAGRVENAAGWLSYRTGDTWVIPPGCGPYRLFAETRSRVLKFYVPDADADFRQPLAKRRVRESQINRIVFN